MLSARSNLRYSARLHRRFPFFPLMEFPLRNNKHKKSGNKSLAISDQDLKITVARKELSFLCKCLEVNSTEPFPQSFLGPRVLDLCCTWLSSHGPKWSSSQTLSFPGSRTGLGGRGRGGRGLGTRTKSWVPRNC